MYHTIRSIHLYCGLALLIFIVMYFISGFVMVHEDWFGGRSPVQTTRETSLRIPDGSSPETYAAALEGQIGLRGKPQPATQRKDGSRKFVYARPGVSEEAVVRSGGHVTITRTQTNALGLLIGYHRLHGFGGGWLYNLWAVIYDLASLSMIVFALSGIYLWYKLTRRRWVGYAALACSFGFAGATMLYLLYAA